MGGQVFGSIDVDEGGHLGQGSRPGQGRHPGLPLRTAVAVGSVDRAAETRYGVRPLLATIAATGCAMLTAILWA